MADPKPPLVFRTPSAVVFDPPTAEFMSGPWHVTHSTLPMWKKNRNVVITYTPLSGPTGGLDDLVQYNPLGSEKQKTVKGVDTPDPVIPCAYDWRGKGLLKIASSHWEVLGYGGDEGGWMVTYFQKTLFTPAGIDVYAKVKGGFSEALLENIRREMKNHGDADFKKLADSIFKIRHDR